MRIFSRRWGHEDVYRVSKTSTGWDFESLSGLEHCDTTGAPSFFNSLKHDSVNYPAALPEYMDWLWQESTREGMSEQDIQMQLNLLAEWISATERNSPRGVWESFS